MNCVNVLFLLLVSSNSIIAENQQLEELNDYIVQLLKSQILINDTWNKTKELIQQSLTVNELPVSDIFSVAREKIKMEANIASTKVAEDCIQETEIQFYLLFKQTAETMLNCVSSKSRKVIMSLLQVQEAVDDALNNATTIQGNIVSCSRETSAAKAACLQLQVAAVQHERAGGATLFPHVDETLVAAKALPTGITTCAEHLVKYIRGRVQKVVGSVKDCVQKANN